MWVNADKSWKTLSAKGLCKVNAVEEIKRGLTKNSRISAGDRINTAGHGRNATVRQKHLKHFCLTLYEWESRIDVLALLQQPTGQPPHTPTIVMR